MKKHQTRCRKCGRFMKSWGWLINFMFYFTIFRGWCCYCITGTPRMK